MGGEPGSSGTDIYGFIGRILALVSFHVHRIVGIAYLTAGVIERPHSTIVHGLRHTYLAI